MFCNCKATFRYHELLLKDFLPILAATMRERIYRAGQIFAKNVSDELPIFTGALRHSLAANWGDELGVEIDYKPPNPKAFNRFSRSEVSLKILDMWGKSDIVIEDATPRSITMTFTSTVPYYPKNEFGKSASPTSPWHSLQAGRQAVLRYLEAQGNFPGPGVKVRYRFVRSKS